jgi:hypothetical protein
MSAPTLSANPRWAWWGVPVVSIAIDIILASI